MLLLECRSDEHTLGLLSGHKLIYNDQPFAQGSPIFEEGLNLMNIEERQQRGSIEYTVPIDSEKSNEDLLFGSASFAADYRNRDTLYRCRNHRRISDTFSRGHSRCISLSWRSHHVCGLLCCRESELPIGMIGERFRRLNHS